MDSFSVGFNIMAVEAIRRLFIKNLGDSFGETDTVDYVHLNHIVKEEMAIRSKLLEEVAQRILNRFFKELRKIKSAKVSVSKINPPIGGNVAEVVIILTKKR